MHVLYPELREWALTVADQIREERRAMREKGGQRSA
jgi:hypothetical protein